MESAIKLRSIKARAFCQGSGRLQVWLLGFLLFVNSPGFGGQLSVPPGLHFSQQPGDSEIFAAHVFDEPLVPLGGKTTPGETMALANALVAYANRTSLDDFTSLTSFLDVYPASAWRGSLLLHLGVEYYNYGYYSKALATWEQAWKVCEPVKSGTGKAQADRALGELVRMYSKLGMMHQLEQLLDSTKDRLLTGPATQMIANANDALWTMKHHPEVSFRCGPMALNSILAHQNFSKAGNPLIAQSSSSTNGFSLLQVAQLSQQLGMNYQMAFRSPGAPLIVPSVLHWKANHYAALLEQNGDRYLVQDPTFHSGLLMTVAALDNESSGYFLVPAGLLPTGWRTVSDEEAAAIFGKGLIGGPGPGGPGPQGPSTGPPPTCNGMTTYNMNIAFVSLTLHDIPVGYVPPVGPSVKFTATYNQDEPNQPPTFSYSNLGQKWTCDWISYISDNPGSPGVGVSLYQSGGGTLYFSGYTSTTKTFAPELETQAILTMTSTNSYLITYADGTSRSFGMSDGSVGSTRRIFLTGISDSAGNSIQFNYDSSLRITNIVDAIGQSTTLSYTNIQYPYAITSVGDPFGRTAYLQYNSTGLLSQITDVLGLTSQYTYGASDFVTALQTPYGTSTFVAGSGSLKVTNPLGQSEYLLFDQSAVPSSVANSQIPHGLGTWNNYLEYRNTFYWDKKAYADGAGDYTKATIYHFCHDALNPSLEDDILESIKKPLENRVWYNYQSQQYPIYSGISSRPTVAGRILDDGTTQLYVYGYNLLGNITNSYDPLGRTFSYVYATNGVDLLTTVMTHNGKHEVQKQITYNFQHKPLTITDAAGQTTTNTYNARGQLLSTTDPLGEVTTFNYNFNGYVTNIVGDLQNSSDVTSFTYDGFGRVQTATDTEGYTLAYNYDAFDRKTRITHPDGTFEQFVYSNLDLVASADRLGRWTTNTYNADRQLTSTLDPLGRLTQYEWCRCGAMTALIDPLGRTTTWDYDVQSRPTAKHYADGSTITYTYENTTSRLKDRRDEKGQDTVYEYYPDNNLKRVSYPNATVPTPTVTYAYDPDYNRVLTMQDGIGTTAYSYNPVTATPALGAGRLASVSGPLPNSLVTYQYDALGRAVNRAINGVAVATTFDSLGRPVVVTNALGTFHYSYVDATARPAADAYPNGQTNLYTYYNTLGDERLQQILHLKPNGSLLSSFGYAYNPAGQIIYWTNRLDTTPARWLAAGYDAADQLTNAVQTDGVTAFNSYAYAYDAAGNRLQSQINGPTTQYSYNALNQLTTTVPANTNAATYEWDAENRLTVINQGTNRSEFSYDGLGRRVQIIEKTNGVVQSDNYYLWCETTICEVRDSSGATVLRRLFSQGESFAGAISGTNYYYTRDHLHSVCEATDANGILATRYSYDPYGKKSVVQENIQTTSDFTGDFVHQKSGLYLTLFRVLDSTSGRWLSRDPIAEAADIELYRYVHNNPLNRKDPLGLQDISGCASLCALIYSPWDPGSYPDYVNCISERCTPNLPPSGNGGGGDGSSCTHTQCHQQCVAGVCTQQCQSN